MDRSESMAQERGDAAGEARRKMSQRLMMAGIIIVILLGALAMFDHLSKMDDAAGSADLAPAGPVEVPKLAPPPEVGLTVHSDSSYPVGAPPPPPIQDSTPPPPPPIQDTVLAPPPMPSARPPKPEVAASPTVRPIAPLEVSRPAVQAAPSVAVPEETSGRPMLSAPPSAASRPVQNLLKRGYILQAGVFSSAERAEELKARLELAGVPVSIESRVRVGPFASNKEANEARAKIKAMGIESILIPPRGAGR